MVIMVVKSVTSHTLNLDLNLWHGKVGVGATKAPSYSNIYDS